MSVTIATGSRRLVLKIGEAESEEMFNQLVIGILGGEKHLEGTPLKEVVTDAAEAGVARRTDPTSSAVVLDEETNQDRRQKLEQAKYRGFLHIKCQHCSEVKGYNSKTETCLHRCSRCGEGTELQDLKQLIVNCECGKRFKYFTNMTEPAFDVSCINCGNPVAVAYNPKKDAYETIQGKGRN